MTTVVQHMTYSIMADQIRQLTAGLTDAVEAGDLAAVSRADHALRSAVIALVGGAALAEDGAQERLGLLVEALEAVRAMVQVLSAQSARQAGQGRANLVYLKFDRQKGAIK